MFSITYFTSHILFVFPWMQQSPINNKLRPAPKSRSTSPFATKKCRVFTRTFISLDTTHNFIHLSQKHVRSLTSTASPVSAPAFESLGYQPPPFNLEQIRQAIPKHLWEKNAFKSLRYLMIDFIAIAALAIVAATLNNPLFWPLYWFVQGTLFWSLFVIGHDCGHRSFSNNNALNDFVGHLTHSSILVPFHGWRISHRTHHQNHGNVDTDESWYPYSKSKYDAFDNITKEFRFSLPHMLIGYPIYLLRRTPGKQGSHFLPNSPLFLESEGKQVIESTSWCIAMLALLATLSFKFGPVTIALLYGGPLIVFWAWLVVVTYLHHTEATVPWYRGDEWNYLRGALSTTDRDYGIINKIHHDIGTHVVHHIFPQLPHYSLVEATEAIKPVLGEYYREPEASSWFLPFHLVGQMIKNSRECRYVDDHGDIVFYKTDKK